MENSEILQELKKILNEGQIKQNELMKNHTSFKIGGPADFYVKVKNIDEIKEIILLTRQKEIPLTLVGNGSNILVLDNGIRGIVVNIDFKEFDIEKINDENAVITVGAGVTMPYIAQMLLKQEIEGFEELSGIPGTIGGAIAMNAGAHGKEIKDIVEKIKVIDYNGNIHIFTNKETKFEYRKSIFLNEKYVILEVKMMLKNGNRQEIENKMKQYSEYRKEKQPIEYPSAGSTFKRGENFVTAQLIDEAGLKGYKIGGAEVSTKHAGFIINKGNATAEDVLELIKYVKNKVYEKFNENIDLEIKILGER